MPMDDFENQLENLTKHVVDASRQSWLLGAGIGCDANIPLMSPLTKRVDALIHEFSDKNKLVFDALREELTEGCNVEHYLSHLCDLIALSERTRDEEASLNGTSFSCGDLKGCHREIIKSIGAMDTKMTKRMAS